MTPNTKALNTAPPLDVSDTRVLCQTHHALVLRRQRATRDHGNTVSAGRLPRVVTLPAGRPPPEAGRRILVRATGPSASSSTAQVFACSAGFPAPTSTPSLPPRR